MAFVSSFSCTTCGNTKGEGNRWLMGRIAFVNGNPNHDVFGYSIGDWHVDLALKPFIDHFCSEACALKRQSAFIRRDRVDQSVSSEV